MVQLSPEGLTRNRVANILEGEGKRSSVVERSIGIARRHVHGSHLGEFPKKPSDGLLGPHGASREGRDTSDNPRYVHDIY